MNTKAVQYTRVLMQIEVLLLCVPCEVTGACSNQIMVLGFLPWSMTSSAFPTCRASSDNQKDRE